MKQKRVILLEAVSTGNQAAEDKNSIPDQDARLHVLAETNNWNIVDIILVPGHSRVYYTYQEFAEDALAEGITAPMRMFEHWKRKDFDVFACSSGDRFGREQSIFAEVILRTIDAGAVVHTLRDGEINQGNKRMFISMGGYSASVEIDELRRRYNVGMTRRAVEGKPLSPRVMFSHQLVRDELGKAMTMTVREELRPLFNDVATLLLERVSWVYLERRLFERFGHVADNGKPFPRYALYHTLTAPSFWGNSARHARVRQRGAWVFDNADSAPEGVTVYYNTHEAVYTGDLAAEVQAELRRRFSLRGSARPDSPYALSSLFVCAECGYKLAWARTGSWRGARCSTAYGLRPYANGTCSQRKHLSERYALDYLRELVRLIVSTDDVQAALASMSEAEPEDETPVLERQLEQLEADGRILIQKQLRAPVSMSDLYEEQINVLGKRIEGLRERISVLKARQASPSEINARNTAVLDIQALGEKFWEQPPGKINQVLRRLFAGRVFAVRDGEICELKRVF